MASPGESMAWSFARATHDVRGSLMAASGTLDLLRHRHEAALPPEALRLLDATAMSIRHAQELLAPRSSPRGSTQGQVVADLEEIAQAVAGELQPLHPDARIEWAPLPRVACNPLALRRILHNLLLNAVTYGGARPRVQLEAASPEADGFVQVTIRDTGPGIDPRDVLALFHPKPASQAHGHGLPNALELVLENNGRMWIDCANTPGAVMHFTLPRVG